MCRKKGAFKIYGNELVTEQELQFKMAPSTKYRNAFHASINLLLRVTYICQKKKKSYIHLGPEP